MSHNIPPGLSRIRPDSPECLFIVDDEERYLSHDRVAGDFRGYSGVRSPSFPLLRAHHTNPRINGHALAHQAIGGENQIKKSIS